jgi:ATP-dependent helicase HrpB
MLHDGATIAALLSEKDITRVEPGGGDRGGDSRQAKVQGDSDLTVRMQMLDEAERYKFAAHLRDRGIDPIAARQVAKTRDELLRNARRLTPSPPSPGERAGERGRAEGTRDLPKSASSLRGSPSPQPSPRDTGEREQNLKLPLLAYPDRVCRRRASDPKAAAMVGGGGVRLGPESGVWQSEFFVALDARHDERNPRSEAVVRIASAIRVEWLGELFPQSIRRVQSATFDESRGKVVGLRQTFYRDLLIDETKDAAVDPEQAAAALAEALRPRAREIFAADESAQNILARVALLRQHMPEQPWPAFDDAELGQILADGAQGKRGIEDLKRASLAPLLTNRLHYPLDRLLEQHAPTAIEVPTGNRIKLEYAPPPGGKPPILAVRLQELFGMIDTPRVAGGRVPVVLHLLGPNYRPVQITEDLRSFWTTTYFQVRKDLRVRYPKHSWPDDPLTAKPVAKGGRRRI